MVFDTVVVLATAAGKRGRTLPPSAPVPLRPSRARVSVQVVAIAVPHENVAFWATSGS